MRPAELRAEAARARAQAAKLLEYAETCDRAVEAAEQLTHKRPYRIVSTMDAQTAGLSHITRRAATRATRKSDAQRILYEHDMTVAKLAAELGEGRARVSKWFGPVGDNRPIPRKHAEYIRDKYGIPLTAWQRIAD